MEKTNCRGAVLYWLGEGRGGEADSLELEAVLSRRFYEVDAPKKGDIAVWWADDPRCHIRHAGIVSSKNGPKIRSRLVTGITRTLPQADVLSYMGVRDAQLDVRYFRERAH